MVGERRVARLAESVGRRLFPPHDLDAVGHSKRRQVVERTHQVLEPAHRLEAEATMKAVGVLDPLPLVGADVPRNPRIAHPQALGGSLHLPSKESTAQSVAPRLGVDPPEDVGSLESDSAGGVAHGSRSREAISDPHASGVELREESRSSEFLLDFRTGGHERDLPVHLPSSDKVVEGVDVVESQRGQL